MTRQAYRRRLAAIEARLEPPETPMTIGITLVDLATGEEVGQVPARPIIPGERVDYRRSFAEEAIWYG